MDILDTRDLKKRQEELQDELNDLKEAVNDAQEEHLTQSLEYNVQNMLEGTEEYRQGIIDDIQEAKETLEEAQEALQEWKNEYQEELDELNSLENEIVDYQYGATMILESDFAEYAQELAEDLGSIKDNEQWPYNCIDWDKAADELREDYTTVTYKGNDYLVRA